MAISYCRGVAWLKRQLAKYGGASVDSDHVLARRLADLALDVVEGRARIAAYHAAVQARLAADAAVPAPASHGPARIADFVMSPDGKHNLKRTGLFMVPGSGSKSGLAAVYGAIPPEN